MYQFQTWKSKNNQCHPRQLYLTEECKRQWILKVPPNISTGALVACENIRFSSLFVPGDEDRGGEPLPCETSPTAQSGEKRMFSQASALEDSTKTHEQISGLALTLKTSVDLRKSPA